MSVIVERNGPIITLIIAYPERHNVMNRPTTQALTDTLREFETDGTVRIMVLTDSGSNFCTDADLAVVAEDGEQYNHLEAEDDGPMGPSCMQLDRPLIAAIEGYAVAGGPGLALPAGLRVITEDVICGAFYRRFGVSPVDGGSVRLPRIIGQGWVLDLILTGRPVKADGALQIGLADRAVPGGSARAEVEELVAGLTVFPQTYILADHANVYAQRKLSFDVAPASEFQGGLAVIESGETLGGVQRFRDDEGHHGRFE